jgi:hypothetical protein
MADPTSKKSNRAWLLLLLLLLLWWWWSRRKKTAAATSPVVGPTTSANLPFPVSVDALSFPPEAVGQGVGYQSVAGFAPGDVSDSALSRVAPETIAMLDAIPYEPMNYRGTWTGLYSAYLKQREAGYVTPDLRAAIAAVLDPAERERQRAARASEGMRLAAEAAARDGAIASGLVHTQLADVDGAGVGNTADAVYVPPPPVPTTLNPAVLRFDAETTARLNSDGLYARYVAAMNGTDNVLAEQLTNQVLARVQGR